MYSVRNIGGDANPGLYLTIEHKYEINRISLTSFFFFSFLYEFQHGSVVIIR